MLALFHPRNPTGAYQLSLSQQAHCTIAHRLLELYRQQHVARLCSYPLASCWHATELDGKLLEGAGDPQGLVLPREGQLRINFVDLRPVPWDKRPLSRSQFLVLLSYLVNTSHLDAKTLVR